MKAKKRNAQVVLVNAINQQHCINQRLLEILEEIKDKIENGIFVPKRLEIEFEQLSQELSIEITNQAKAEISLGMHENLNFILN